LKFQLSIFNFQLEGEGEGVEGVRVEGEGVSL